MALNGGPTTRFCRSSLALSEAVSYIGVTRNLGAFGASTRWLDMITTSPDGPDLVALQELPHAGARLKGYRTLPQSAARRELSSDRRSALLVRETIACRPAPVGPLLKLL